MGRIEQRDEAAIDRNQPITFKAGQQLVDRLPCAAQQLPHLRLVQEQLEAGRSASGQGASCLRDEMLGQARPEVEHGQITEPFGGGTKAMRQLTDVNESFDAGALTRDAWWYYLPPGLAIMAVVLAFTLCGQALEEILDPRLKDGRR